eukprot:CAMPEP_0176043088 /NCGR_PEP_ID=MMETSP0120_2-20121206/21381_1 /TAXON_ID=160619 /ORGANISM="Kryptoperidinium foliaceum, Strain CCMP 1326" /LENGTH=241 /DNA_ID=CAMNT_0017376495 /DNA_START=70 /DNA_END=796 /DNA_ORIENTATION=+
MSRGRIKQSSSDQALPGNIFGMGRSASDSDVPVGPDATLHELDQMIDEVLTTTSYVFPAYTEDELPTYDRIPLTSSKPAVNPEPSQTAAHHPIAGRSRDAYQSRSSGNGAPTEGSTKTSSSSMAQRLAATHGGGVRACFPQSCHGEGLNKLLRALLTLSSGKEPWSALDIPTSEALAVAGDGHGVLLSCAARGAPPDELHPCAPDADGRARPCECDVGVPVPHKVGGTVRHTPRRREQGAH